MKNIYNIRYHWSFVLDLHASRMADMTEITSWKMAMEKAARLVESKSHFFHAEVYLKTLINALCALPEPPEVRDANAALERERDALRKEVAHLREAMTRDDGPQYLANLLMEAEAALFSAAQQRGEAERERDALREAAITADREIREYLAEEGGTLPLEIALQALAAALKGASNE